MDTMGPKNLSGAFLISSLMYSFQNVTFIVRPYCITLKQILHEIGMRFQKIFHPVFDMQWRVLIEQNVKQKEFTRMSDHQLFEEN